MDFTSSQASPISKVAHLQPSIPLRPLSAAWATSLLTQLQNHRTDSPLARQFKHDAEYWLKLTIARSRNPHGIEIEEWIAAYNKAKASYSKYRKSKWSLSKPDTHGHLNASMEAGKLGHVGDSVEEKARPPLLRVHSDLEEQLAYRLRSCEKTIKELARRKKWLEKECVRGRGHHGMARNRELMQWLV